MQIYTIFDKYKKKLYFCVQVIPLIKGIKGIKNEKNSDTESSEHIFIGCHFGDGRAFCNGTRCGDFWQYFFGESIGGGFCAAFCGNDFQF